MLLAGLTLSSLNARKEVSRMSRTESEGRIEIIVSDGCIECPFSSDSVCSACEEIRPSHDYSYPVKCPLLTKTVLVQRQA